MTDWCRNTGGERHSAKKGTKQGWCQGTARQVLQRYRRSPTWHRILLKRETGPRIIPGNPGMGQDNVRGGAPGFGCPSYARTNSVYRVRGLLHAISQHSKATAPRRPEKANRLLKANQHFNSTHQDSHSLQRTARSAQTNKSMDDKDVNLNAALGTVSSLLKFSDPFIASTSFFRTNLKQFS